MWKCFVDLQVHAFLNRYFIKKSDSFRNPISYFINFILKESLFPCKVCCFHFKLANRVCNHFFIYFHYQAL